MNYAGIIISYQQNLLMRYGERHNLTLAIPGWGNYFGAEPAPLTAKQVESESVTGLDFNIFAMHSKWNMAEVGASHRNFNPIRW